MVKKGVDNVVRIPCKLDYSFFKMWFMFLQPFHHLTEREMEVATSFVKQRYELSKVVSDNGILDRLVMSEDTKRKVREECNITLPHFQVIMGKLRKNNIIVDGKLNPRYIPRVIEENGSFKLMLLFDFQ
nr:MAG TPA: hypothetical protein [Crassvirales sp.]